MYLFVFFYYYFRFNLDVSSNNNFNNFQFFRLSSYRPEFEVLLENTYSHHHFDKHVFQKCVDFFFLFDKKKKIGEKLYGKTQ